MSLATIAPVAQALYLCDGHIGYPGGKTDLVGLFNSIRDPGYPHVQRKFVVFADCIKVWDRFRSTWTFASPRPNNWFTSATLTHWYFRTATPWSKWR